MSQILPINIKGLAGSVATLSNWLFSWLVTLTANMLLDWSSGGLCALHVFYSEYFFFLVNKKLPFVLVRNLHHICSCMCLDCSICYHLGPWDKGKNYWRNPMVFQMKFLLWQFFFSFSFHKLISEFYIVMYLGLSSDRFKYSFDSFAWRLESCTGNKFFEVSVWIGFLNIHLDQCTCCMHLVIVPHQSNSFLCSFGMLKMEM